MSKEGILMKYHLIPMFIIEPVYTELPGWEADISGIREFNKLPEALKLFIEFIENQTGVPVTMVSVGPDREETIFRK